MIRQIAIWSRQKVRRARPGEWFDLRQAGATNNIWVIAIRDPAERPYELWIHPIFNLRLTFHDVEVESDGYERMSAAKADAIAERIRRIHADERPGTLLTICEAGLSRSAAVALVASEYAGLDWADVEHRYGKKYPNGYMVRELRRRLGLTPIGVGEPPVGLECLGCHQYIPIGDAYEHDCTIKEEM